MPATSPARPADARRLAPMALTWPKLSRMTAAVTTTTPKMSTRLITWTWVCMRLARRLSLSVTENRSSRRSSSTQVTSMTSQARPAMRKAPTACRSTFLTPWGMPWVRGRAISTAATGSTKRSGRRERPTRDLSSAAPWRCRASSGRGRQGAPLGHRPRRRRRPPATSVLPAACPASAWAAALSTSLAMTAKATPWTARATTTAPIRVPAATAPAATTALMGGTGALGRDAWPGLAGPEGGTGPSHLQEPAYPEGRSPGADHRTQHDHGGNGEGDLVPGDQCIPEQVGLEVGDQIGDQVPHAEHRPRRHQGAHEPLDEPLQHEGHPDEPVGGPHQLHHGHLPPAGEDRHPDGIEDEHQGRQQQDHGQGGNDDLHHVGDPEHGVHGLAVVEDPVHARLVLEAPAQGGCLVGVAQHYAERRGQVIGLEDLQQVRLGGEVLLGLPVGLGRAHVTERLDLRVPAELVADGPDLSRRGGRVG